MENESSNAEIPIDQAWELLADVPFEKIRCQYVSDSESESETGKNKDSIGIILWIPREYFRKDRKHDD